MSANRLQRYIAYHTLDLRDWGFTKTGPKSYKGHGFISVLLGKYFAVFSCRRYTKSIDYNNVDAFLREKGIRKNTISQESREPGDL